MFQQLQLLLGHRVVQDRLDFRLILVNQRCLEDLGNRVGQMPPEVQHFPVVQVYQAIQPYQHFPAAQLGLWTLFVLYFQLHQGFLQVQALPENQHFLKVLHFQLIPFVPEVQEIPYRLVDRCYLAHPANQMDQVIQPVLVIPRVH